MSFFFSSRVDFILILKLSFLPAAALPSAILTLRFTPYQRGIYCDDKSISYPYRKDTISHGAMAAVTITCSIVIVSPKVLLNSNINTFDLKCFPNLSEKLTFCLFSLHRSPLERPTLCTQSACTQTPSSTSTCQLFTRWSAPSCLGHPSANH